MSVSASKSVQQKSDNKPKIPLPAAIAGVVVLVVLSTIIVIKTLNPSPPTSDLADLMTRVAKEAGPAADMSKINPADMAAFKKAVPEFQQERLKSWIENHPGK